MKWRCAGWVRVQALRMRSELYCVCRKPYDEDVAMIACDQCSEWYHYRCLGLAEPEADRRGGQQDGAEFVCPDCDLAQHVGMREACGNAGASIDEKRAEYVSCCMTVFSCSAERDIRRYW